jgi:hypothetical protein
MFPADVEDRRALSADAANRSRLTAERPVTTATSEPTLASTWLGVAGIPITDELLEWPADLFALTDVLLERAESYRLVFSAPDGGRWPPSRFSPSEETTWPPGRFANWSNAVEAAARDWCVWTEDHTRPFPALLAEEWSAVLERASMPLEQLAQGRDWRICEALLIVHTIADEACAGLFAALDRSDGRGFLYRARGRELLARTGSLARIPSHLARVLPKVSTPRDGGANLSRYVCVQRPGLETRWYKLPARHPGTDSRAEHVNVLMLPWPLRVRESDFRPVEGSVSRLSKEPFGLFEFAPSESLDLDLVDRTLVAARDEVNHVDVVVLPESAVEASEIDELETLLDRHGVMYLQTGVRERSKQPGRLGANYVHVGVNPRLHRGRVLENEPGGGWLHIRQNKHHRWSLDERQVYQYNLAGALHPKIRWWEAMDVPRRSLQLLQVGEITIASLVCEDLAQNDGVAEIIRSVGPTIVVAVLLDGPQLTSRWAARYASVLADDPGSAVLTLTSYGMVQRSRPPGHDPSSVVALWKDPERGTREISLEPGAHGVILTLSGDRATRRSADGRWPVDTGTRYFDAAVHQIRASSTGSASANWRSTAQAARVLEADELTILTGWAEGVAEALAYTPSRALSVLADAHASAPWRASLGIPEPSPRVSKTIDSLTHVVIAATPPGRAPTFAAVLAATREDKPDENALSRLTRRALRSTLEQLRTRQAKDADR